MQGSYLRCSLSLKGYTKCTQSDKRNCGSVKALSRCSGRPPLLLSSRHSVCSHGEILSSRRQQLRFGAFKLQVEAAGRGPKPPGMTGSGARSAPELPPLDPDNPQFMLFVRSSTAPKWYPVNVVTGGSAAKMALKAAEGNIGSQMFKEAITKNIADVLYKEEEEMNEFITKNIPILRMSKSLQWGYKLLETTNVREAMKSDGIVPIPPKGDISNSGDKLKENFEKMTKNVEGLGDKLKGIVKNVGNA